MKKAFILCNLLLMLTPAIGDVSSAAQNDKNSLYIQKYKNIAIEQMVKSGIPASITLAQACLESGFGTSSLATKGNNHFGIKCHDFQGETMYIDDEKKGECFRVYDNAEASFNDHTDFLRYRDRYASLFDLEPTDYKAWAYGLKAAGYATAPNYAVMLIDLIEKYDLHQYDNFVEASAIPNPPNKAKMSENVKLLPGSPMYKISLEREILKKNNVLYIEANGYETFASIAAEFNLFTRELLKFNDEKRNRDLKAGEIVYLEAKKHQADKHLDKHVVEEGETMHSLSQQYAVKLKYLYKYNPSLNIGTNPEEGSIINLK